ncbi:MAG: CRISPR-associated RAMP Cmr3 [uncultured Sulfurovum sp.]|uniref:CRISPR-associated RAMP Cmr3 n=1 Tax=uncultured Sulfurovum sp. TaxID=269237 RepID=A0A6S6TKY7_9BACT|nr:MAG: CRISPR-associated RAMP Cmr3 [uncultured Sulfurovum sp.]
MSHTYLITLKPLEPFFFGGEFTFGADETRKESSRYSATSTQFPQQTALLGMLRKTMLIQNGNLTMHRKGEWVDSSGRGKFSQNHEDAKNLAGTGAFSYENSVDLGSIVFLSPIFIKDGKSCFTANAKDYGLELKAQENALVSFGSGRKQALVFQDYDAKKHECFEFISQNKKLKNFEDFFKEIETVGIKKSKDSESDEDGFFRKKSYFPQKSAHFAFFATFSEPLKWNSSVIVSLGADQSSFALTLKEELEGFELLFKEVHEVKELSRMVLVSETVISQEAYEACSFIWGKRTSFRQLTNARHGKKSKRYYLLERGSVLYTEDLQRLDKALNQEHLRTVGINHYFKIEGKKHV